MGMMQIALFISGLVRKQPACPFAHAVMQFKPYGNSNVSPGIHNTPSGTRLILVMLLSSLESSNTVTCVKSRKAHTTRPEEEDKEQEREGPQMRRCEICTTHAKQE